MKRFVAWTGMIVFGAGLMAYGQAMPKPEPSRTVQQVLDRALTNVEHELVPAAEVMPEDKFGYAPTDGEFKGVRTFAQQIKHVAATNYEIAAAILQVKPPIEIGDDEAENVIASDPYQRAGVASYERITFNGAFRAPGL